MSGFTRREALRRGVIPLVAITSTGGLAGAVAWAGTRGPGAKVTFATVLGASDSSLTVATEDKSVLTVPVRQVGPPHAGNPFRIGEWVVLGVNGEGAVVGVEPLSDYVSGAVERHDGNRLAVAGVTFLVDEWSLARVEEGENATIVPLSDTTLSSGAAVGLLVRRGPAERAARRVAAAFVAGRQHAEAAVGGVGG